MLEKVITSTEAHDYATKYSTPEDNIAQALNNFTVAQVMGAQMISGHLQGNFLKLISMMLQPKNVIELGTYTGYATMALCEGLQPNGKVYTIDTDEKLQTTRDDYWQQAGLLTKIEQKIGKALEVLPTLNGITFDLAFIDADKGNYINYVDFLLAHMPIGGIILADNTLFHGEVFQTPIEHKTALKIHQFNQYVQSLDNIFHVLLPIRDGITLIRKMK